MTVEELIYHMNMGREFEFSLGSKEYFMSGISVADYEIIGYYIFDCARKQNIFEGTMEEILSYEFEPGISFRNCIEDFSFDYIL